MTVILNKDGTPFKGEPNLDLGRIIEIVEAGIWTDKELADRGLVTAISFVEPPGQSKVGEPRYVETKSGWVEEYDTVSDPPLGSPPTPEEKLFNTTGLTVDDLRKMLSL